MTVAVAAETAPKKGDVVMTKHHGRGVILDKKGGNYNVLLDKKDRRGRSWQQFFEPAEIEKMEVAQSGTIE